MATEPLELDIEACRQLFYRVFPRDRDAVTKFDKLLRRTYWIAAHNAQTTANNSSSKRIEDFFVQWVYDGLSRCLCSLSDPRRLSGAMALDLFELVCERTSLLEPLLGSDLEHARARPPTQAIERTVRAVFGEHYPAAAWNYGRHVDEPLDPSMSTYAANEHEREIAKRQEASESEGQQMEGQQTEASPAVELPLFQKGETCGFCATPRLGGVSASVTGSVASGSRR